MTYYFLTTILYGLAFTMTPVSAGREAHAIYLSVAEIDHKADQLTAVMKLKVFSDDMEDALRNMFGKSVKVVGASDCTEIKTLVNNYFEKHFSLIVNSNRLPLSLNKCESVGDASWFYFVLDCPSQWGEVQVMGDYLMELFPTQSNVISIVHREEKKFVRLTMSQSNQSIKF